MNKTAMQGMTTGQKLRALRGKRTLQAVADELGVTLSAYVKYERDERVPCDAVKKKIATLYKADIGFLFFA